MRKGLRPKPETAALPSAAGRRQASTPSRPDYQLRANEQMVYTAFGTARIDAEGLSATCPPPTFPIL